MCFIALHETCNASCQGKETQAGDANLISDLHTANDNMMEQGVCHIEIAACLKKRDYLLPCLTCTLGGSCTFGRHVL